MPRFLFALSIIAGIVGASGLLAQTPPPLAPAEAAKSFTVADDLVLEQVLAEPVVAQPVFLNFDERGRMWVVQYLQYPTPAGLKMVSRDDFWRAVYDKVPPAPPHHFNGADKITIHEDTDGDGTFDKHKTFLDGLNIVTAVERGRGGVWVLNPPYLLFYPDRNDDDVPDGDPVVHLQGFGLEDTHSVANSLRWGPDGWLYAAQGSTVSGHMIRPGLDTKPLDTMGQLIWRYHPEQRRFEVFAEGGGNAFGVELDAQGRVFSGHNGGNTRGFHYVQGGYLQKGFDKHGPLSNHYAFGYFPPMKHADVERFTHNFVIYEGGALPATYVGKLIGIEPLQGRVVLTELIPDGSTFRTRDVSHPVTSSDHWFKPVDIKVDPDGAIYLCDWYDAQVNHFRNHEGQMDAANGRIYRLRAKSGKPVPAIDYGKKSSAELVGALSHPNKWVRQTALRLLADRRDASIVPSLLTKLNSASKMLPDHLWALHLSGGLTEASAATLLKSQSPQVRLWTIRLLGDENKLTPSLLSQIAELAKSETSLEVRSQLASTARRLPAKDALAIVRSLLIHDADAQDERQPLLLWWAIESKVDSDRAEVMRFCAETELWQKPLMQQHLLERLARRFAQAGARHDFADLTRLFELSPSMESSRKLASGLEAAFKGRSLAELPPGVVRAMQRHGVGSEALKLRLGDAAVVSKALQTIADEKAPRATRLEFLQVLAETKLPEAYRPLTNILATSTDAELTRATLAALATYNQPEIAPAILARLTAWDAPTREAALIAVTSRPAWSLALVQAVVESKTPKNLVSTTVVRRLRLTQNTELAKSVRDIWGENTQVTSAEMDQKIKRLAYAIQTEAGDPYRGQTVFHDLCASCHVLHGKGGQVGPDLTTYQRSDLENLLLNIINPSAEIREGYENLLVETKDDRSLNGFLVERDDRGIVLRGLDGRNLSLATADIAELRAAGLSLMPEGLLDTLDDQQVRDLFAYLRSSQPLLKR